LPCFIAHGLCTMAMSSCGVISAVAGCDVHRLKRLAVRFSKLVFPGDALETQFWGVGAEDGPTTSAFRPARGADLVLTDGLAVVAD
ncbi:MaoC/PaaZ C-terminal domain-containing protein, partial [Nocardia cyriacigeorgica]|uniref:MaoC/PaaZ C-terminal domain-containing protein n=1 Tax=Nocardia cyriacigeorgica TaxID=135487 RepID=UPI002453F5AB